MFNPSSSDVRRFFCETYRKHLQQELLSPLENIARDWIVQHPEYADDLKSIDAALARDYSVDNGQTNPFLHLAMHLSIAEQIDIDQPPGIRKAAMDLANHFQSLHTAHHQIAECLGEMLWNAQRSGQTLDGVAYLACIQKRLG